MFGAACQDRLRTAKKQEKASNFSQNIEIFDYCFAGCSRDIIADRKDGGARTLIENFDAYGEVLPNSASSKVEFSKQASAVFNRIVQYIFWSLVVVIVLARIFYFSPSSTFEFRDVLRSELINFLPRQYDIDSYWRRIDEQKSVLAERRTMGTD